MAQVKLRKGRILFTLLLVAGVAGWLTFPHWKDRIHGTPLEDAPALLSRAGDWLKERLGGLRRDRSVTAIAEKLPSDAAGLMVLRGIDRSYARLVNDGDMSPDQKESLRSWSISEIGIDLTDPEAVKATGFDFSKPWAVAGVKVLPSREADAVAVIPVSDEQSAVATVRSLLRKNGLDAQERTTAYGSAYVVEGRVAFTARDGLLVLTSANLIGYDPVAALRARLEQDRSASLAQRESFQEVLEAQGSDWLMFGYFAPDAVRGLLSDEQARLARSLTPTGAGFSVSADDHRLRLRTTFLSPDSALKGALVEGGSDKLAKHIEGEALAAGRASIDLDAVWQSMGQDPELKRELETAATRMRGEWGIDLKTDVIDILDGRFSAVVLAEPQTGSPIETALGRMYQAVKAQQAALSLPMGAVGWVGVEDMAKARQTLDAVAARVGQDLTLTVEHDDDTHWYYSDLGGVGLARDHLIAFFGAGRLEALKKSLKEGQSSYLDSLPSSASKKLVSGPASFFYLDVKRSLDMAARTPFFGSLSTQNVRDTREMIQATFPGISVASDIHKTALNTDYELLGPEQGFSSVQHLWEQKAKQLQGMQTP